MATRILISALLLLAFDVRANVTNAVAAWSVGPYVGIVGDSIAEGYNEYSTYGNGGPAGDTAFSLGHRLYSNSGSLVGSTNFATPNKTWTHVLTNQLPLVLASQPKYVFAHCGINDIFLGRTWAAVRSDMESILASCTASNATLILGEIFPDSNFDDAQSLTVRTWNTNYAEWAATRNVVMLSDHDMMGQTRGSTGYLDDLATSFDQGDGVHISAAAYDAWSTNLLAKLITEGWLYYVATNGSDTASGTAAQPWLTIAHSTNSIAPGDTVIVGPGTFDETVTVYTNGTAANPITYRAQSLDSIVRFFVVYGSYVTVDGFTLMNGTETGAGNGVSFVFPASNSIVQNCYFPITNHSAIYCVSLSGGPMTEGPLNIIIRSNYLSGCGYSAAMDLRGYGHIITNNIFTSTNGGDGIYPHASGMYIGHNLFTNWFRPEGSDQHTDLIQAFSSNGEVSTNNIIDGNLFLNPPGTGCQIGMLEDQHLEGGISNWIWRNNVYSHISGIINIYTPNMQWYNNTFYKSGTNSSGPLLFRVSETKGSGEGGRAFNNIFYECASWGGGSVSASGLTNIIELNSLIKSTTGGDDPLFVNADANDFRLQVTSPAIGAATNLSSTFTTDLSGATRGALWDIGAYEYAEGTNANGGGFKISDRVSFGGKLKFN